MLSTIGFGTGGSAAFGIRRDRVEAESNRWLAKLHDAGAGEYPAYTERYLWQRDRRREALAAQMRYCRRIADEWADLSPSKVVAICHWAHANETTRDCFLAWLTGEYTFAEIGEMMGLSTGAVQMRVGRLARKLIDNPEVNWRLVRRELFRDIRSWLSRFQVSLEDLRRLEE